MAARVILDSAIGQLDTAADDCSGVTVCKLQQGSEGVGRGDRIRVEEEQVLAASLTGSQVVGASETEVRVGANQTELREAVLDDELGAVS
jgi:hypothetical protein